MIETIGDLIETLGECDQTALVFIDNEAPTGLSSYRGYYDQLAIERRGEPVEATSVEEPHAAFTSTYTGYYQPGTHGVYLVKEPTVAEFVKALNLALYRDFEGYKGGQFEMTYGTDIWVSEYGDCERLRIKAVEQLDGRVDLVTEEVEW